MAFLCARANLLNHLKNTTAKIDGVEFRKIYFVQDKEEFILVLECVNENQYLEWGTICPPPNGAKDWYEVLLIKNEKFHN